MITHSKIKTKPMDKYNIKTYNKLNNIIRNNKFNNRIIKVKLKIKIGINRELLQ